MKGKRTIPRVRDAITITGLNPPGVDPLPVGMLTPADVASRLKVGRVTVQSGFGPGYRSPTGRG